MDERLRYVVDGRKSRRDVVAVAAGLCEINRWVENGSSKLCDDAGTGKSGWEVCNGGHGLRGR